MHGVFKEHLIHSIVSYEDNFMKHVNDLASIMQKGKKEKSESTKYSAFYYCC
jgi:hypothetical protein